MITLEANYSKKLGLPNYSSHQFSVSLKTELADVSQAEQESARLYDVLQNSVDSNIRQVGFLPSETKSTGNGNGNGHHSQSQTRKPRPGQYWRNTSPTRRSKATRCRKLLKCRLKLTCPNTVFQC